MRMVQTEISAGRPSVEIFYDGQIPVDYNEGTFGIVDVPYAHWRDVLIMRGYRDVEDHVTEKPRRKKVPNE